MRLQHQLEVSDRFGRSAGALSLELRSLRCDYSSRLEAARPTTGVGERAQRTRVSARHSRSSGSPGLRV